MSSGITVSVTVKPYVFRWISSVYGIPAKFPKRSYLNFLLGQLIAKPPSGFVYRLTDDNLLIELPFFTGKDVRVYSWLSENSKKELVRSIRQQFYVSMFDEVEFNRYKLGMSTGTAIRLFMEK
ncbi:MAG: hypothetical protein LBC19_00550 [Tannerella sp.]|jgi:hypothetical protein|nr:hypothetical protein [Tannerella sp.]